MKSRTSTAVLMALAAGAIFLAGCRCPLWQAVTEGKAKMTVEKTAYGKLPDGRQVDLYTLTNANGLRAKLISFGAILAGLELPDRDGKLADVTLGHDTLDEWRKDAAYMGATVGRYGNRIAKGQFSLDGKTYKLATNNGPNHLHGGKVGFNKVLWDAEEVRSGNAVGVQFTYRSKDGEEGYPGKLTATAVYTLTNDNELRAEFAATTDKPTVVNLVHHSYWNLGGAAAGDILGHVLMLNADQYTPVDETLIPTGELKAVKGTPLDFTTPTAVGKRIAKVKGGYDHNYVLRGERGKMRLAARVVEPKSGRVLEIHTDQPGIQFYSGNFLGDGMKGKGGIPYPKHHGLCLETQHYPDSPNKPAFPSVVLRPGETYRHIMIHRFSTE